MDLLKNTGVPIKNSGDGLTHQDVNSINSTVNNAVDTINTNIKNYCNINQEVRDFSRTFTLEEAIVLVPQKRRLPGLVIKFVDRDNQFKEYLFNEISVTESNWTNLNNWKLPFNHIDGGEWEISD